MPSTRETAFSAMLPYRRIVIRPRYAVYKRVVYIDLWKRCKSVSIG